MSQSAASPTSVVLPKGSIGVVFAGTPPIVKFLRDGSAVAGLLKPGMIVTGMTIPGSHEVTNTSAGELVEALKQNMDKEGRTLMVVEGLPERKPVTTKSVAVRPSNGRISDSPKSKSTTTVRKAKSFRRIRGLFSSSRKSKKDSKRRQELAAEAGLNTDEDKTVYNVHLDDRSVSTATVLAEAAKADDASVASVATNEYLLRMVLLLLDTKTRRFELLQLEFDTEKAQVSDVLNQVSVSVTERTLRSQEYRGVVTSDCDDMSSEKRLSDFCKGNDVLVAVPRGLSGEEVANLARPILSDIKVLRMLQSSGVDPKGWVLDDSKSESESADDASHWRSRQIPDFGKADALEPKIGGTVVFGVIALIMAFLVLKFFHAYISSPIQPGQLVSPGLVISKCGILSGWPLIGPRCNRAYLEVASGAVSYYEGKELAWMIHGNSCAAIDTGCVDGLEFKTDGSLAMGGVPIYSFEWHTVRDAEHPNDQLSPWPFTEVPKVRAWDVAANKMSDAGKKAAGRIKTSAADTIKKAAEVLHETPETVARIKDGAATTITNAATRMQDFVRAAHQAQAVTE